MKRNLLLLCLVATVAQSCRQADIRTVAIHIPGLKSQNCATIIQRQLGQQQGIGPGQIQVNLEARSITVKYDSLKQSIRNLEYAVADAGFDANDIPANKDAQAKLPADCR